MAAPGDLLGGRFELIEVIGSGGMAVVWRARDTRLRRTVAVKILRPQFAEDPDFVERFESEARHAASLAHPNVAAVYDTGFDAGPDGRTRYIVMELVDGPSVAEVLRKGAIPIPLAIDVAIAAARALAAAHRRGIVHRDVKPGNLLIGPDGRVRLADFGIARALTATRLTTAGTMFGSAPYMSPEQARGDQVLPSSDLYSLGVVLFEMLHGRLPERGSPAALLRRAAGQEDAAGRPAPGLSSEPSLPAGLDAIVARALDPDPTQRHPSARAFAEALESAARRLRRSEEPDRYGLASRRSGRSGRTGGVARTRKGRAVFGPTVDVVAMRPNVASGSGHTDASDGSDVATTRLHRLPRTNRTRRRRSLVAVIAGLSLVAGAGIFVAVLASVALPSGGVLRATATPPLIAQVPGSSSPGGVASIAPAASPVVDAVPSAVPPTSIATAVPTPRPTLRPTPRPTVAPASRASTPNAAVADFYDAAAAHDWNRAIARWSEGMKRRYPPDQWLIGRFSRTTRIEITRLRQTSLDATAGRATVAVTLVEDRTVEPSPWTLSGRWELIRVNGRWLLDNPHF